MIDKFTRFSIKIDDYRLSLKDPVPSNRVDSLQSSRPDRFNLVLLSLFLKNQINK